MDGLLPTPGLVARLRGLTSQLAGTMGSGDGWGGLREEGGAAEVAGRGSLGLRVSVGR